LELFSSLSKSATLIFWWISIISTFCFGTLFLVSWLSEEFATSDKWRKHRKLLITLAIIGVGGEQLSTIAEFGFAEHLQTISDHEVGELNEQERLYGARHFTNDQRHTLISDWQKYAGRTVTIRGLWDPETDAFSFELEDILLKAGLTVRRDPNPPTVHASGVIVEGSWADFTTLRDFAHSLNCAGMWANDDESCTGGLPPCAGVSRQFIAMEPKSCDLAFDILPRLVGHRGETLNAFAARLCKTPLITQKPTCAP
jgi:hypothetical protein